MSLLATLDVPAILSLAFYPRTAEPDMAFSRSPLGVQDGQLPVDDQVSLGYRLYAHAPDSPVIVYFHGNGEIAPDHDYIADYYHRIAGVSLLVIDFRGYGWSSGTPTFSTLIGDCKPIMAAIPGILAEAGLTGDPYVMGRSMGSAPAIELATGYPDRFAGLIIESGFADFLKVLTRLGFPGALLTGFGLTEDPIGNVRKIASLKIPLQIIHGEDDTLIPISHADALFEAAPVAHKSILRVPGAGHNDLQSVALGRYFEAIGRFIQG